MHIRTFTGCKPIFHHRVNTLKSSHHSALLPGKLSAQVPNCLAADVFLKWIINYYLIKLDINLILVIYLIEQENRAHVIYIQQVSAFLNLA